MLTADFCCAPGSSGLCCCIFTCSPRKAVEAGDAKTAVVLVYLKQRLSSPVFVGLESCGSGQVTGRHSVSSDSIEGAVTICVKGDSDAACGLALPHCVCFNRRDVSLLWVPTVRGPRPGSLRGPYKMT